MTITRLTPTDSGNTTYTVSAKTLTLPTGATTGDLVVVVVTEKPDTSGDASINNGFTLVRSATGGTGTQGADAGPVKANIFAKILDGTEGTITITPGSSVSSWCHINFAYQSSLGGWGNEMQASAPWTATASDTATASPVTGSTTPTTKPVAGDIIDACAITPTDSGTGVPTTATITAAGLSGGTVTPGGEWAQSSTGNDCGMVNSYWTGFTGTASSTIAVSITNPGATNSSGVITTHSVHEVNAWTEAPADNEDLTDTEVYDRGQVEADTADLTETQVYTQTHTLPTDTEALTDTDLAVSQGFGRTLPTDTAALTDTLARELGLGVLLEDTLALSDVDVDVHKSAGGIDQFPEDPLDLTDSSIVAKPTTWVYRCDADVGT